MSAFVRALPLAVFFLGLPALNGDARAADGRSEGPAVIVFDGSGSMWGTVGTERPPKYELLQGVLRKTLSTLSPRVALGLTAFGHRRRGDCSDIQTLAEPATGAGERILALSDDISPRGRGPLTQALRTAASQIPADRPGTIIAIHDGPDNCSQDPCAAAQEIARSHPQTRIYTIGFGLPRGDAERMRCVGEATGGRMFETQDSAGLDAALSEALTLAGLIRVDPETGVAVPIPKAATPPKAVGAPGLRLSASLAAGGPSVTQAVSWSVAKASAPDKALATGNAPDFAVELEPGSYVVTAELGRASAKQTAEVGEDGPTDVQVPLGAGALRFAPRANSEGAVLREPLITVYDKGAEGGGDNGRAAAHPVWVGRDANAEIVLPDGVYAVEIEDGLVSAAQEVTLAEGASMEVAPILNAGRLELASVSANSDEPIEEVVYIIEEDDPFSPKGRREVARSADPGASFTLPAGTYHVIAKSGAIETGERLPVGSGDVIKHVAVFNIVRLTVSAIVTPPMEDGGTGGRPVVIRVLSDSAPEQEIARAYSETGVFHLPPGAYRVDAKVSGTSIRAAGRVELAPGRDVTAQITLESGEVSVAGAASSQYWRIKDSRGHTVMHAGDGSATTARLAPGHYDLVADGALPKRFELKAGERQEVRVDGP